MNRTSPPTGLKLKLTPILAFSFITLISTLGVAQQVTDAELRKYIVVMDSIETLKNQLVDKMNKLATSNSKISQARYNALIPIINDQAKLTEGRATSEEIAFVKKVAATRDEENLKFQQTFQSLIINYIGNDTFTKVRNSLKSDAGLKKRYDSLMVKPVRP